MPEEEPIHASPIGPLDWLKAIPFEPAAWSDRLGWVGLEAVCCRTEPAFEPTSPLLGGNDGGGRRTGERRLGGPLATESLANLLAVHLIRHVIAPPAGGRGRDGVLPLRRLRAVVDHIEEHLGCPSLGSWLRLSA